MSVSATTAPIGGVSALRRAAASAGAVLAVSFALAVLLGREAPPPPLLVAVAGVAALAVVGLVLVRYEVAIAIGLFGLLGRRPLPARTHRRGLRAGYLHGRAEWPVSSQPRTVGGDRVARRAARARCDLSDRVGQHWDGAVVLQYHAVPGAVRDRLASYVDCRRRSKQVVVWYLTAALISAALGVLAVLAPIPGRGTLLFDGRAEGFFKDPNVFGPFLIPALLILLEETVAPRLLPAPRRLKLSGVILLGLGVLFSYSRAAWLDLAVALVTMLAVLLLRRHGARTTARLLAVLFVILVSGGTAIAVSGSGSFLQERAALQGYDASRFSAQAAGISLGEHHPIGVGPGQVDVILPLSTHNAYVRAFAEQGPLGLLLVLALLLGTLGFAARNAVHGRDTYGIGSAVLLAAWCGLLVNSAVIDTLHWRHLWIVAALIWAGAARSAVPLEAFGGAAPSEAFGGAAPTESAAPT